MSDANNEQGPLPETSTPPAFVRRGRALSGAVIRASGPVGTQSRRTCSSSRPRLPIPTPASLPPREIKLSLTLSADAHSKVVKSWLEDNPSIPWITPPAPLHDTLFQYLRQPLNLRDGSLLPQDISQQRWFRLRTQKIKVNRIGENGTKRWFIANELNDLHSILLHGHIVRGRHGSSIALGEYLKRRYLMPPCANFVKAWCGACPGCHGKKGKRG